VLGVAIWLSIRKDAREHEAGRAIPSGRDGADVVAGAPPAVSHNGTGAARDGAGGTAGSDDVPATGPDAPVGRPHDG
jgi:hypothetical protein